LQRARSGVLFLVWAGALTIAYYVAQRPDLYALPGLVDTLWTLVAASIILFNSYGLGIRAIHKTITLVQWISKSQALTFDEKSGDFELRSKLGSIDRLPIAIGIGLGVTGLLGLAVSALHIATHLILTTIQLTLALIFLLQKDFDALRADLNSVALHWRYSFQQYNLFSRLAVVLPVIYSFFITLTPPFEAFDVLSYHLTQPERILQDGGLRAIDITPFWYPNITENVYLWTLAMRAERAAQIMHFAWGMLAVFLVWRWATRIGGLEIGRKSLLLIASIGSLPILAGWAYADMALVFYTVAALYALYCYESTKLCSWVAITGIMAGFAMGVKYTSFMVPVVCGILILFKRPFIRSFKSALLFSVIAIVIAVPWYARNAVVMHNPFYPFVFDGLYWDSFRAEWYSNTGTGIGWDISKIVLIPLDIILGHRELTSSDGNIGPVFLILLPPTIWILLKRRIHIPGIANASSQTNTWSLTAIGLFAALSFVAWTLGVINSKVLWQIRFYYPALIPFAIPTAIGWDFLKQLDTPKLRLSYFMNALVTAVVAVVLFSNGQFVLQRNPLALAFGIQSRERFLERVNPSYASLIQLMDELPAAANVYALYEPRTYNLPRPTQPDIPLYNFAHDLYLHHTSVEIIRQWQMQGYTHILVYERGRQFMLDNNPDYQSPALQNALSETLGLLQLTKQTQDQVYSIYKIP